VNLATVNVWRGFIQQTGQLPDETRFRLPAQAEEDEVVAGEDGIDHLRHHGVFVTQDAGKQRFTPLDFAHQIVSKFVFDGSIGEMRFGKGTVAQRAECTG
jgi:hypothetical protein